MNDTSYYLELFQKKHAILEGHFLLSSGLHSPHYVQCARIFEDPLEAEKIVAPLVQAFSDIKTDWVVGPAMGGILLAYELARKQKAKNAFAEREEGKMTLRRGFTIPPGSSVIVAEDVITTGGSILEVAQMLEEKGAKIEGVAALINRSSAKLPYRTHALLSLTLATYPPETCPLCREGKPIEKPGSRKNPISP
jgi:orotate phosphoribosyltransferase